MATYTQRDIRDPRKLQTAIEALDTRVTALGGTGVDAITLTGAEAGAATINLIADEGDDAGDKGALVMADGGALAWQTDKDLKGTLATKLAIGNTGIVTLKGGATLDNTTSATELNITETAVKVTGTLATTGAVTAGGNVTLSNGATLVNGDANTLTITEATVAVVGAITASGAATLPLLPIVAETGENLTLTAALHAGKVVAVSSAGACAITLPANDTAAGTWIDVVCIGTNSTAPTISAAVADTLIAPNDDEADSVTFGSGHRIGAYVRFIATGAKWVAVNVGSTTMTVNT
jgi:hypothetical protein